MGYAPIEDHGIIGDMHSVALVDLDGRIDWCCLPYFDSPSVFGRIVDEDRGGEFSIRASGVMRRKQMYLPETNVLINRSYTEYGVGQVENFMPVLMDAEARRLGVHRIVRRVRCVRGNIQYTMHCAPAFDYARARHEVIPSADGVVFETPGEHLFFLSSPAPLNIASGAATLEFSLKEGEELCFVFACMPKSLGGDPFVYALNIDALVHETIQYWHRWVAGCTYDGRWSEMVYRSALVLKLLTFEPTGAIVAAPTAGLPEFVGGVRNWDYRYTWIRDASFTVYALMRIGFTSEAERFMDWVTQRLEEVELDAESPLSLMYTIHGKPVPSEIQLDHLCGYRGSRPVRIGNAASHQLQLDIFGELMDAFYVFNKYGKPVSYRQWTQLRKLMTWVSKNWEQPDESIWETRGGRQDFVFSRVMCWVALDRAVRMSVKDSLPGDRARWTEQRDRIYDEVMMKGWSKERHAFRQHYGTHAIDAANLLLPLFKFISPSDPRMLSTIDAALSSLTADSLVFRYDPEISPDGIAGEEGTFCVCTFWLVECLSRAGRLDEARVIFQRMLNYANHLGLYGEELGPQGEILGNYPQAFTHLGLISAAYNLNEELRKRK